MIAEFILHMLVSSVGSMLSPSNPLPNERVGTDHHFKRMSSLLEQITLVDGKGILVGTPGSEFSVVASRNNKPNERTMHAVFSHGRGKI
jgi:hypothetical protein